MHLVFTYSLFSVETSTPVIVPVPGKFQKDFESVLNRFVQLFDEVFEILKNEESVTPAQLKLYVSKNSEMRDEIRDEENVHTISDIIDVIQKHSSYTRCTFLEGLVTRFKVSAAAEKIEKYKQFVEEFCQQELIHHIYMKPFLTVQSTDFNYSTTITFKLRWSPEEKTLSHIQDLLQQTFEEQSVFVNIVVIRGGSVRVIFCAPLYLMTELVRLSQKNRELLVESSVTYLRVGDTIVVDTSDQNEVRICYHRNCVTLDCHHQISLVKDLVLQLTIALQLKGDVLRVLHVVHIACIILYIM